MLGGKDLEIGFIDAIKAHDPAATDAAKAARKVTARATLVALALKILALRDSRNLTDEQLRSWGVSMHLAGGDSCEGMRYADILERARNVRSWGGKGGRLYDKHKVAIHQRMLEKGITEEAAVAELAAVTGESRDA
jgi:hypothetical protein